MILFLPELTLLIAGLVLFLASLANLSSQGVRNLTIGLAMAVVLSATIGLNQEGSLFYESYRVDFFSQLFKLMLGLATLVALIFSGSSPGIKQEVKTEYYLFLFIGLLGLMMLVSSVELIAIFIALELSSFAVYIMVPMRDTESDTYYQMEAGIKYLLFGVMSTAFMLYGMSYLFGLTGSTYLDDISTAIQPLYTQPAAMLAMVMFMAGFFYKLALFPFMFWVPDVYEGAANETTSFIAAVPKLAAVALLIRLVALLTPDNQPIITLLLVCSLASMFYGNLSALAQTDFKRMLGFSGIAHAGFILFALLTLQQDGYAIAIYYIAGYAVMSLACFLVICQSAKRGENMKITDLTGLYKRSPLLAFTLAIGLFALAGIPPFVGFTGKFIILINAFKQGYTIPVVLAAINTAIAIYYYLSAVRLAYCTDPDQEPARESQDGFSLAVAGVLLVIIVIMGIMPAPFLDLASTAVSVIF
jgi:NADH-quinone oxidoreductase subunit N